MIKRCRSYQIRCISIGDISATTLTTFELHCEQGLRFDANLQKEPAVLEQTHHLHTILYRCVLLDQVNQVCDELVVNSFISSGLPNDICASNCVTRGEVTRVVNKEDIFDKSFKVI